MQGTFSRRKVEESEAKLCTLRSATSMNGHLSCKSAHFASVLIVLCQQNDHKLALH